MTVDYNKVIGISVSVWDNTIVLYEENYDVIKTYREEFYNLLRERSITTIECCKNLTHLQVPYLYYIPKSLEFIDTLEISSRFYLDQTCPKSNRLILSSNTLRDELVGANFNTDMLIIHADNYETDIPTKIISNSIIPKIVVIDAGEKFDPYIIDNYFYEKVDNKHVFTNDILVKSSVKKLILNKNI
jgi:hypothetical protein